MFKKLALFAWIFTGVFAINQIPSFGQNTSEAEQQAGTAATTSLSPEVQEKLQHLSSTLGLSSDQQEKIKPILQGELSKLRSVQSNTSMGSEQREKQAEQIHASTQSEIQSMLTPEQQQKLAKMREDSMQK
ncbi:MAG TPA: hypothetical protein VGG46_11545 [Terriglobales bacterium]